MNVADPGHCPIRTVPFQNFHRGASGVDLLRPVGQHAVSGEFGYGRYWARTSDPQLVELVLSQLS